MKKYCKNKAKLKVAQKKLMKNNLSYCWDKMLDEDLRPLREYYCKSKPTQQVIIMNIDYNNKNATLFFREAGDIKKETFDWCKENLVLLNEFNK